MKLITFAVPCYNSQEYMRTCIESLLPGGDDVEILIIDDGSKDDTGMIAEEYEQAYPTIVRAIRQKNGGHGAGVNKGLKLAQGLYYKVVDSDDHLEKDGLLLLLDTIRQHLASGSQVDLYIMNFIYDHTYDGTRYVSHYRKNFPSGKIFGWEESRQLRLWHMLLMHALIYRTELLRNAGTVLPEHTSYVDNLFAYQPMLFAKKLFYLDKTLYLYTIGRPGQSVTVENMVSRYEQQIKVMTLMLEAHSYAAISKQCRPLQDQMYHCLNAILSNTYFFTTQKDEPERKARLHAMWEELRAKDPDLYQKMQHMPLVMFANTIPWKMMGKVSLASYRFLTRYVKLG